MAPAIRTSRRNWLGKNVERRRVRSPSPSPPASSSSSTIYPYSLSEVLEILTSHQEALLLLSNDATDDATRTTAAAMEKAAAIEAAIRALESREKEEKTGGKGKGKGREEGSAMREFKKVTRRGYVCPGAERCGNALCYHYGMTGAGKMAAGNGEGSKKTDETTKTEKPVDIVTQLLMDKSEKDGFRVSASYATKMLKKHDNKLVLALKAIKDDITTREQKLKEIGRISFSRESMISDGYHEKGRARDLIIQFYERDDENLLQLNKYGWSSNYGQILQAYNEPERSGWFNLYLDEAKFRDERQTYYKKMRSEYLAGKMRDDESLDDIMSLFDDLKPHGKDCTCAGCCHLRRNPLAKAGMGARGKAEMIARLQQAPAKLKIAREAKVAAALQMSEAAAGVRNVGRGHGECEASAGPVTQGGIQGAEKPRYFSAAAVSSSKIKDSGDGSQYIEYDVAGLNAEQLKEGLDMLRGGAAAGFHGVTTLVTDKDGSQYVEYDVSGLTAKEIKEGLEVLKEGAAAASGRITKPTINDDGTFKFENAILNMAVGELQSRLDKLQSSVAEESGGATEPIDTEDESRYIEYDVSGLTADELQEGLDILEGGVAAKSAGITEPTTNEDGYQHLETDVSKLLVQEGLEIHQCGVASEPGEITEQTTNEDEYQHLEIDIAKLLADKLQKGLDIVQGAVGPGFNDGLKSNTETAIETFTGVDIVQAAVAAGPGGITEPNTYEDDEDESEYEESEVSKLLGAELQKGLAICRSVTQGFLKDGLKPKSEAAIENFTDRVPGLHDGISPSQILFLAGIARPILDHTPTTEPEVQGNGKGREKAAEVEEEPVDLEVETDRLYEKLRFLHNDIVGEMIEEPPFSQEDLDYVQELCNIPEPFYVSTYLSLGGGVPMLAVAYQQAAHEEIDTFFYRTKKEDIDFSDFYIVVLEFFDDYILRRTAKQRRMMHPPYSQMRI